MANVKEIRNKIRSVQNTQKITRAMQTVAASKMRRAQERMREARPYAEALRRIAAHLSSSMVEFEHPYLRKTEKVRRVAVIVVTSDKGLAGGLNTNLFRRLTADIKAFEQKGIQVEFVAFGAKGFDFLQRMNAPIIARLVPMSDSPRPSQLIGPLKLVMDRFLKEDDIDEVYLAYTRFINTMQQEPVIERVLPLSQSLLEHDTLHATHPWEYIFEPDKISVIDGLFRRYIEYLIYQGVAENNASEQSARMVAMKAASDNADHMIDALRLEYNKTRQAAITTELNEIVSGAAAV